MAFDIVDTRRSNKSQPAKCDRGEGEGDPMSTKALDKEQGSKKSLMKEEKKNFGFLVIQGKSMSELLTIEIGMIWLTTLGFATARPPTAEVTDTATGFWR